MNVPWEEVARGFNSEFVSGIVGIRSLVGKQQTENDEDMTPAR